MKEKKDRMTNREFSVKSVEFTRACQQAKVWPTARQASKWRRGQGACL